MSFKIILYQRNFAASLHTIQCIPLNQYSAFQVFMFVCSTVLFQSFAFKDVVTLVNLYSQLSYLIKHSISLNYKFYYYVEVNPEYPCLSNKMAVTEMAGKGRGLVATQPCEAGELITVEESMCTVLYIVKVNFYF